MPEPSHTTSQALAIVIMAAGKGTRLKSKRAKVLHEIGGRPLLAHVIAAAKKVVAARDIYVVVGHQADAGRAPVAPMGVQSVLQTEQRGTGHAIMCALTQVQAYQHLLLLSPPVPLTPDKPIPGLRPSHLPKKAALT